MKVETTPVPLTVEEKVAWDQFAAAVLSIPGRSCASSALAANKMIRLRRKAHADFEAGRVGADDE